MEYILYISIQNPCVADGKAIMHQLTIFTNLTKIAALIYLLAMATGGYRGKGPRRILIPLIIPVSIALNWLSGGIGGLLFSLSGIAVASLCLFPLSLWNRLPRSGFVDASAVGTIFGPTGSIAVFAIALILQVVEWLVGGRSTSIRDRFAGYAFSFASSFTTDAQSSPFTAIEAKKVMIDEYRIIDEMGGDSFRREHEFLDAPPQLNSLTLPWRARLALATLSILISGLFI